MSEPAPSQGEGFDTENCIECPVKDQVLPGTPPTSIVGVRLANPIREFDVATLDEMRALLGGAESRYGHAA